MNRHRAPALLLGLTLAATVVRPAAPPAPRLYADRPLKAWLADLDSPDLLLREEAVEVLAKAGPAAKLALPKLRAFPPHDNPPLPTRAALAVWRLAGDAKPAVHALSTSLAESSPPVRREALTSLGEMGAAAVPAVGVVVRFLDDTD